MHSFFRTSAISLLPATGATVTLARALITGSPGFYLEARPVRAAGSAVLSEPFNSVAGDEIFWSIPP